MPVAQNYQCSRCGRSDIRIIPLFGNQLDTYCYCEYCGKCIRKIKERECEKRIKRERESYEEYGMVVSYRHPAPVLSRSRIRRVFDFISHKYNEICSLLRIN